MFRQAIHCPGKYEAVCNLHLLGRMKRLMKRMSSQRGADGALRRALLKLGAIIVGDTEVLWVCNCFW